MNIEKTNSQFPLFKPLCKCIEYMQVSVFIEFRKLVLFLYDLF
jgi:hypothetical protein